MAGDSYAAARRAGLIGQVVGVGRSEANLAIARERGLVDRTTRELAEIGPVDLVVLAVPLALLSDTASALSSLIDTTTIVTDVGSVKAPVVAAIEAALKPTQPFVGGHPIAGTERIGAGAADAGLFRGAREGPRL